MACFIFLADGFEDMEALGTRDVLLRGGASVQTISMNEDVMVCSSHGQGVFADCTWDEFADAAALSEEDILIFPGGMPGSKNLAAHKELMALCSAHWNAGRKVAAICAAPGLVLSQLDGLEGRRFTCFEGFQDSLIAKGAVYTPDSAVTDGNMITGRAAGHAIAFGLAILESIKGREAVERVRSSLML